MSRRVAPRPAPSRRGRARDPENTASAWSASTRRSPSVPHCCAPPTPPPPADSTVAGCADLGPPVVDCLGSRVPVVGLRRSELVVVPRSVELQAAEDALGLALVVMVGGARPPVSPAMVSHYLFERFGLLYEDTDIRCHDPEDFVVRFRRDVDRDRVLAAPLMGPLLPLWPWRRTSMANGGSFRSWVLIGMRRVPLHARSATTAQAILGRACARIEVVRLANVPVDDDWEFFITAWCLDPHLIPDEKIMFIPEPQIHNPVQASSVELPGLWYLVRLRVVAFEDWNPPPASPGRGGYDGDGDGAGPGDGSGNSHLDSGAPNDDDFFGGRLDDEEDGSGDSNYNHYHPGLDHCGGDGIPVDASGATVEEVPGGPVLVDDGGPTRAVTIGSVPCPLRGDSPRPLWFLLHGAPCTCALRRAKS